MNPLSQEAQSFNEGSAPAGESIDGVQVANFRRYAYFRIATVHQFRQLFKFVVSFLIVQSCVRLRRFFARPVMELRV